MADFLKTRHISAFFNNTGKLSKFNKNINNLDIRNVPIIQI